MHLATIDWIIIIGYVALALGAGVLLSRKAGGSIANYFLAGRTLPWWLAGTSIVATTFAADTPLAVAGLVRHGGIYENWFWWSAAMSAMLGVAFYARLWRRSGVTTDLEFIELRYSGRPAAVLRGFLAVYAGVVANCIGMGWVMLAVGKIFKVAFGWPEVIDVSVAGLDLALSGEVVLLTILITIVLIYTTCSGMWGVVLTDLLQFVIAMFGAVALMVLAYRHVGGPSGIVARLQEAPGFEPKMIAMVPNLADAGGLAVFTFAVYLSVQWWASTTGASSQNQRILSTRDERQATYGVIWGAVAHYVLRPWPWIVVGLVSIVFYPPGTLNDPETAYPRMMTDLLPPGLLGLMLVSFLAAFMSTLDTHLNWGSSYLINDLYKRFVNRDASQQHYVVVSRLATVLLVVLAAVAAWQMESIAGAWKYLLKMNSGIGLVVLLRWFWWRINPWSEIAALCTSFLLANVLPFIPALAGDDMFAVQLCIVVGSSALVWVTVTLLTPPSDSATLADFYRRIRPGGWWGPVARQEPGVEPDRARGGWLVWAGGVACIYAGIIGLGWVCLGSYGRGTLTLLGSVACGVACVRAASRFACPVPSPDAVPPLSPARP